MAQDHLTTFRPPPSHRRRITLRRRRPLPIVRLGGKRQGRGQALVRALRLKWLKMQYLRMIKKLKQSYKSMVRDMIEAGSSVEAFQQSLLMEASFGVPIMGVSSYTPAGQLPRR